VKDSINRWVIIFILFILVIAWNYAIAEPVARAADKTAEIILYSDDCKLPKTVIRNLPFRVVWNDRTNGIAYEGCWGPKEESAMMYFEDGSVALLHIGSFTILRGV
jgi:hypothetical protein